MHKIANHKRQKVMKKLIQEIGLSLAEMYPNNEEKNAIIRAICCDLLGYSTAAYYMKEEVILTAEQEARLSTIIYRLQQGEPLQYIEGKAPFCGMDFVVKPGILIPRPETAELVEWIVQDHDTQDVRILDLGTGSGCIAISLSKRIPQAIVEACDISHEALAIARENSQKDNTSVQFFHHDMLDLTTPLPHSYNILVSNPPYIKQSEAADMEKHVTEWEPHTALFVPDDLRSVCISRPPR